ncbi:unnamed protein product [Trichobilharzia szidati]|nr:unnamed protein product [Trichobilharzia szidati]
MSGDFNFPPSQDFELSVATSKPGGKNVGYSKPSLPVKQPMSAYVDFNPWYERWNRLSHLSLRDLTGEPTNSRTT